VLAQSGATASWAQAKPGGMSAAHGEGPAGQGVAGGAVCEGAWTELAGSRPQLHTAPLGEDEGGLDDPYGLLPTQDILGYVEMCVYRH